MSITVLSLIIARQNTVALFQFVRILCEFKKPVWIYYHGDPAIKLVFRMIQVQLFYGSSDFHYKSVFYLELLKK